MTQTFLAGFPHKSDRGMVLPNPQQCEQNSEHNYRDAQDIRALIRHVRRASTQTRTLLCLARRQSLDRS
jgi:hypothetical protein